MLIYGAHLLRNGAARIVERLMAGGWLTHLATNGAGSIHDWEYAWLGRSTEGVEANVADGTFGAWRETSETIHLALMAGALEGLGYGGALGRLILKDGVTLPSTAELAEAIASRPGDPLTAARADLLRSMNERPWPSGWNPVEHRWKHASIFAQAYRHEVPMTVHPGIGYDIIANHPGFNGAAIGRSAGLDFALFGGSVEGLDGGVVLSVGSAIMAPQVFEKALSCVNNLRLQDGREVVRSHSFFVVDIQDGGGWDWSEGEPPKTNPAYYLRFCKSFSRMGGPMTYAQADNMTFLHHLHRELGRGMNAAASRPSRGRFPGLRVAVVGDFFLDRYLLIDPSKAETSIETGLPVHNVVEVRAQPGAAGTIVNNLVALGVGEIHAVGFSGDDGEGYELRRALAALPGVSLGHFSTEPSRRTPVYCKPLVVEPGRPPRELSRLDSKNWEPTPALLRADLADRVADLAGRVDAMILMDQVDRPGTGVVTPPVLEAARLSLPGRDGLVVLADSRQGLRHFPPLGFKMNAAELAAMTDGGPEELDLDAIRARAAELAAKNGQPVFVTLAERGVVGAMPRRAPEHVPAHPVRGPIDIVGAGDSVTASLAAGIAAGADLVEAMELSMIVASIVVHQLGTTGTASVVQIAERIA